MHALVRPRLQFVTHTLNSASTGQDNKIHERKGAFEPGIMFYKREVRRVKGRRIPDRKRRVEPQRARIRYWTRQERLRIKYIQKQGSVSEEEIVRIARNLSDLHLPFCTPCEGHDLSNETILARLRWTIYEWIGNNPDDSGYYSSNKTSLDQHGSTDKPRWTHPPTGFPAHTIENYISHLRNVWDMPSPLALPSYWPIFSGVDWEDVLFETQTTDTEQGTARDRHEARVAEIKAKGLKESESFDVRCTGRDVRLDRLRRQWELIISMYSVRFLWTYQTDEQARRRDDLKHAGRTDYNQTSSNLDLWPQTSIAALLKIWEFTEESPNHINYMHWFDEVSDPQKVGRLIANIVSTDLFPARYRSKVSWPRPLSQPGPPPVVDYSCQAGLDDRVHSVTLPLMLFGVHRSGEDTQAAIDILARAFQPMMTLFILYYLDSRTSIDEEMPRWMVLFGVAYNEKGIIIQSYYPFFNKPDGWGACSTMVTNGYHDTMQFAPYNRTAALNALYRVQGHCRFVYEQLSRWEGLGQACERLEQAGQFHK